LVEAECASACSASIEALTCASSASPFPLLNRPSQASSTVPSQRWSIWLPRVRFRYAHLSPTHLKAAVETVASFGKAAGMSSEADQPKAEEAQISNGTVTKTVTGECERKGNVAEVVENVGAGDGI
jgi:hypothetical protein